MAVTEKSLTRRLQSVSKLVNRPFRLETTTIPGDGKRYRVQYRPYSWDEGELGNGWRDLFPESYRGRDLDPILYGMQLFGRVIGL